ncbi:MAG: 16S rRNA (uracil(1498)-N(3))-methyltransferase [Gammaproteobacteria bacterium]|nr:16S rRNA (uracil(1498)-N(3))-methyltransferase [Gammaproteobacteria bacterium]MDH4254385.1 16S rRNA (uracil(1498)-N(3))-methyltransferase [Gammaproteobacteria bacterium]MDH5309318.1 16S rRNA (uracil(1498)-N(3))-methyltransferase [Gammaproteobacteria bacterium]
MARHRLYIAQPVIAGRSLRIEGETAHYLVRVLRLRQGDEVALFDNSGVEFPATVTDIGKQRADLLPGDAVCRDLESPLDIRLIQGVSRGERMDLVVQKATELGIRRISPVLTAHSVVRLDAERASRRQEHWNRIAQSACEQCGRNRLPAIDEPRPLADFLQEPSAAGLRLLLHPAPGIDLAQVDAPASVDLLIGPEGGLSDDERELARNMGFASLRMGPRILRTETAALAAIAMLQSRWGDFQA